MRLAGNLETPDCGDFVFKIFGDDKGTLTSIKKTDGTNAVTFDPVSTGWATITNGKNKEANKLTIDTDRTEVDLAIKTQKTESWNVYVQAKQDTATPSYSNLVSYSKLVITVDDGCDCSKLTWKAPDDFLELKPEKSLL
jgi:hypothetical protein